MRRTHSAGVSYTITSMRRRRPFCDARNSPGPGGQCLVKSRSQSVVGTAHGRAQNKADISLDVTDHFATCDMLRRLTRQSPDPSCAFAARGRCAPGVRQLPRSAAFVSAARPATANRCRASASSTMPAPENGHANGVHAPRRSLHDDHSLVLVLDYGSQYTQLICRRIRELNIFSMMLPGDAGMVSALQPPACPLQLACSS